MFFKLAQATLFLLIGSSLAGCAVESTEPAPGDSEDRDEAESGLSAGARTYVSLRPDYRKCMAPMCGGYWVKDVNRNQEEQYVSGLDFGPSGLDEALVGKALEAPAEELILRAKLGPKEPQFGTRALLVYEAYRGMPGVTPIEGDIFFKAQDRNPQIQCFSAPCSNEVAKRLNTGVKYAFDGYQVSLAAKSGVDQPWLIDRINHHDAIVAALFVYGESFPSGDEILLDASQVYINLADMKGPCIDYPLAPCPEGMQWASERNEDMCLVPTSCMDTSGCPSLHPPVCEEGYVAAGWRTQTTACIRFACDPAFVAN